MGNTSPANAPVKHVMIVGGGAAGWLTAALLAKDHCATESGGVAVTLVESPSVAILGVGEGTWPTMRETLRRGGLSEREFITECDASFKQGTRFDGWRNGAEDDRFYHPFTAPAAYGEIEWASLWKTLGARSYADAACAQTRLCDQGRAPNAVPTLPGSSARPVSGPTGTPMPMGTGGMDDEQH